MNRMNVLLLVAILMGGCAGAENVVPAVSGLIEGVAFDEANPRTQRYPEDITVYGPDDRFIMVTGDIESLPEGHSEHSLHDDPIIRGALCAGDLYDIRVTTLTVYRNGDTLHLEMVTDQDDWATATLAPMEAK